MYQFKAEINEEDYKKAFSVFDDYRVSETYKKSLNENKTLLREKLTEYQAYLLSLEGSEFINPYISTDVEIMEKDFEKEIRYWILWNAIDEALHKKNDFIEIILEIIDEGFIKKMIEGKYLKLFFEYRIPYNVTISPDYPFDDLSEILMQKFS